MIIKRKYLYKLILILLTLVVILGFNNIAKAETITSANGLIKFNVGDYNLTIGNNSLSGVNYTNLSLVDQTPSNLSYYLVDNNIGYATRYIGLNSNAFINSVNGLYTPTVNELRNNPFLKFVNVNDSYKIPYINLSNTSGLNDGNMLMNIYNPYYGSSVKGWYYIDLTIGTNSSILLSNNYVDILNQSGEQLHQMNMLLGQYQYDSIGYVNNSELRTNILCDNNNGQITCITRITGYIKNDYNNGSVFNRYINIPLKAYQIDYESGKVSPYSGISDYNNLKLYIYNMNVINHTLKSDLPSFDGIPISGAKQVNINCYTSSEVDSPCSCFTYSGQCNVDDYVKTNDILLDDGSYFKFYIPRLFENNVIANLFQLPIDLLGVVIETLNNNTCEPITIALPFVNNQFTLPCGSEFYNKINGSVIVVNTIGLICSSFLIIRFLNRLGRSLDSATSLDDKQLIKDRWGGI